MVKVNKEINFLVQTDFFSFHELMMIDLKNECCIIYLDVYKQYYAHSHIYIRQAAVCIYIYTYIQNKICVFFFLTLYEPCESRISTAEEWISTRSESRYTNTCCLCHFAHMTGNKWARLLSIHVAHCIVALQLLNCLLSHRDSTFRSLK